MAYTPSWQKNKEQVGYTPSWQKSSQPLESVIAPKKANFSQRMTGTPVQQYDGSFRATTGVTDFLGGLPIFGPFARLAKTYGETRAYNKLDDKTRQILADTNQTKTIFPEIDRKKSSVLFDAGEGILDAATGGISNMYRKGALKTGVLASSKTLRAADLALTNNQIRKRLAAEIGINTGAAYGYSVGQNLEEGQTGAEALKPGFETPVTALLTGILGAKGAAELSNKISKNKIFDTMNQKFNIPDAGTPSTSYLAREGRLLPEKASPISSPTIELPSPDITASRAKLAAMSDNPINSVVNKTSIEERAANTMSRNDFIQRERGLINLAKDINSSRFVKGKAVEEIKITDNQLGKMWDNQHATPTRQPLPPLDTPTVKQNANLYDAQGFRPVGEGEILPNGYTTKMNTQTGEQITNAPFKDGSNIKQGIPTDSTPSQTSSKASEPSIKIDDTKVKEARRVVGDIDETDTVTFKKGIERFEQLIKDDPEQVKKLAMGTSAEKDPVLRDFWALKLMEDHADKTGNTALSYELSLSKTGREAGRELVGGKIVGEETMSDVIRNARKNRAKTLGISEDRLIKEEKDILDNLKKDIRNSTPNKSDSDNIINSIIC